MLNKNLNVYEMLMSKRTTPKTSARTEIVYKVVNKQR